MIAPIFVLVLIVGVIIGWFSRGHADKKEDKNIQLFPPTMRRK